MNVLLQLKPIKHTVNTPQTHYKTYQNKALTLQ